MCLEVLLRRYLRSFVACRLRYWTKVRCFVVIIIVITAADDCCCYYYYCIIIIVGLCCLCVNDKIVCETFSRARKRVPCEALAASVVLVRSCGCCDWIWFWFLGRFSCHELFTRNVTSSVLFPIVSSESGRLLIYSIVTVVTNAKLLC